jgi:hypothetical protein
MMLNQIDTVLYSYLVVQEFSLGAAEFNVSQFGVYIQDNFKITNNFKFFYGLRVMMFRG